MFYSDFLEKRRGLFAAYGTPWALKQEHVRFEGSVHEKWGHFQPGDRFWERHALPFMGKLVLRRQTWYLPLAPPASYGIYERSIRKLVSFLSFFHSTGWVSIKIQYRLWQGRVFELPIWIPSTTSSLEWVTLRGLRHKVWSGGLSEVLMRRAAAQLLDRLGPVDFQVAAVCGGNGMRGRCG